MRLKFEADNYRNQPMMMAEYLNDAFETRDCTIMAMAIGDMARIHGMSELSRETGIGLSFLFQSFRGEIMPKLDTLVKSLAVLGLELQVRARSG